MPHVALRLHTAGPCILEPTVGASRTDVMSFNHPADGCRLIVERVVDCGRAHRVPGVEAGVIGPASGHRRNDRVAIGYPQAFARRHNRQSAVDDIRIAKHGGGHNPAIARHGFTSKLVSGHCDNGPANVDVAARELQIRSAIAAAAKVSASAVVAAAAIVIVDVDYVE